MGLLQIFLPLLQTLIPSVINRVLPAEKMSEADRAKLALEVQKELLSQDWNRIEAEFADRASARTLAAADIAKGNAFTSMLAAFVRPAWGFGALAVVIYSVGWHYQISDALKEIIDTVLYFYFGGRVIEKVMPHASAAIAQIAGKGK
jgi:hypothetical protein